MTEPLKELSSIIQILHLTYHRNKNQHRLAKWWKEFSQLRRNVMKFSHEIEQESKLKSLESKHAEAARIAVEQRVAFLEESLIPSCYVSVLSQ